MFVVQLKFDTYLLRTIANYLGTGRLKFYDNDPIAKLIISDKISIQHLVLPFFNRFIN